MEKSSTPEKIILTKNRGCGTHIIKKSGSQPRRSAKWRECYESTSAPFCRKVKEVEQKKYRAAETFTILERISSLQQLAQNLINGISDSSPTP